MGTQVERGARRKTPKAAALADGDQTESRPFTARMQHDHLKAAFKSWEVESEPDEHDAETAPIKQIPIEQPVEARKPAAERILLPRWRLGALAVVERSTIVKTSIALLVAVVLGWLPVQRLLSTTSAEALINARVVTVRTPISGDVRALAVQLEPGAAFQAGDELMTIRNSRSDRSSLDNMRRTVEQLTTDLAALQAKEVVLKEHHAALGAQSIRYRAGRIEVLEKQLGEIDAQISASEAQRKEFERALERGRTLVRQGVVTQAYIDKATRDESVAAETLRQLTERRKVAEIGLMSARQGTFVTDGYNDTSQSAQRMLEVELQLADFRARIAGTANELDAAKQDLIKEQKREQDLSTAVIRASISGRVWEILTAPGEHVNAGQTLMRLLDCNSAIVSASVSEGVFHKLSIGQLATFKPADGGKMTQGWIVDLSGLAAVASNDAIQSKLVSAQPYHVTLKFPDLASRSECQISRAGLVTFDTSSPIKSAHVRVGDGR